MFEVRERFLESFALEGTEEVERFRGSGLRVGERALALAQASSQAWANGRTPKLLRAPATEILDGSRAKVWAM